MTFLDLLDEYGVRYTPHGQSGKVSDGWIGLTCFDCGGENYLGYNLRTGVLNCWRCGRKSSVQTLSALARIKWAEAASKCKKVSRAYQGPSEAPGGVYCEPAGVGPMLEAHREYLRSRGFNPGKIGKLWEVGGIGHHHRLGWRLFVPILHRGRRVSWTTRSIAPGVALEARYRGAAPADEAIPARTVLYGGDYVRNAVIVHEGPADVWATGPGAVATLGVGYRPAQVALLARVPLRVIAFDGEPEAQARARKLASDLVPFPGRTVVVELESAEDAAACLGTAAGRRELQQLRSSFLE